MRNTSTKRRSLGSSMANQNGSTAIKSMMRLSSGAFRTRARECRNAGTAVFDRAPQPQAIFDCKHQKRDASDQHERRRIAQAVLRMNSSATAARLTTMSMTNARSTDVLTLSPTASSFEHLVNAAAQILEAVACHVAGNLLDRADTSPWSRRWLS